MSEHLMELRLPPFSVRWFEEGENCNDSVDGDLFLIDHGTWEDKAIEVAQELLTLTEPDLHGYTWCAHTAFRRGLINGRDALSEMGFFGFERRPVYDYKHRRYAVVHFNVADVSRETSLANDESCDGLDYGWLGYPVLALDDLTGLKLACTWGDSIICSTHCTLCLMGLGLFPDRPPSMIVPARMAMWFNAKSPPTGNIATQVVLKPQAPETNLKEET